MTRSILKKIPFIRRLAYRFLFWQRENEIEDHGKQNLVIGEGAQLERCKIRFSGSGNRLFFAPGCSVKDCDIEVIGDNHKLEIGEGAVLTQSLLWFEDHDCTMRIGANTTMQRNGHIAVTEPGRSIDIGPDCMFSFNVDIRNGDSHSILDQQTGKRVNWAKNIKIGKHVWLGAHTQILGGAEIGENAIIGIRSLVNGSIPAGNIAVGIPAKPVKSGFTWDSNRITDGDPFQLQ